MHLVTTSEIKISAIVDRARLEAAARRYMRSLDWMLEQFGSEPSYFGRPKCESRQHLPFSPSPRMHLNDEK